MNLVDAVALLEEGIAAYQRGQLEQAEEIARQVLTVRPDEHRALYLLGLIAFQQGHFDEAGTLLQRVVLLAPSTAGAWDHLAILHQLRDDIAAEEEALDRLLALQPRLPLKWGRRGLLALRAGQLEAACGHFARAAELAPERVDVWTDLGATQLLLGRLADAEASQRRAVAADPSSPVALNNLGNVLIALSHWAEAAPILERVVQQVPQAANGWVNLGHALRGLQRYHDAMAAYQRALALSPDHPAALDGVGFALLELGDARQAVVYHERALAGLPDNADIHEHLGVAYLSLGRLDDAALMFRRCLALDPGRPSVHSNLIFILDLMQGAEAEAWEERRRWNAQFGQCAGDVRPRYQTSPDPERRLRVGYVSADFRHHSAAYAILPILRSHDHAQVEVVCYSGVVAPDLITAEFRTYADRWHDVATLPDDDLAALIRDDEIDILVDLSGHSGYNRLTVFARRPAPVQVTAWGYVSGTGLDAMQYLLADPVTVPPEERAGYTEEIVDLPSVLCYAPPAHAPAVSPLPARARGYVTFGAFNRLAKISARVLEAWARVLLAVPSARLLIKCAGADISPGRDRLLGELAAQGVQADRVTLLGVTPHVEHLAAHGEIDVMLDTFPHNGGITTLDALLMGVPVVALLGERVTGRASASFLTGLGLDDLVAATPDEYVAVAARLAGDLDRLERERTTLRARLLASPLGDAALYTRAVEAAYRALWRRWCDERVASCELRVARGVNGGTKVRAARQAIVTRRAGVTR